MDKTGKSILLEIMLFLRGIVRFICKAVIVLIILLVLMYKGIKMDFTVSEQLALAFFGGGAVLIMWGYDQIIRNLCPEDQELFLPF